MKKKQLVCKFSNGFVLYEVIDVNQQPIWYSLKNDKGYQIEIYDIKELGLRSVLKDIRSKTEIASVAEYGLEVCETSKKALRKTYKQEEKTNER